MFRLGFLGRDGDGYLLALARGAPGAHPVLLEFALPLMWLATADYFILMLVLKHEGLEPWKE
jgi:hypothetical protein